MKSQEKERRVITKLDESIAGTWPKKAMWMVREVDEDGRVFRFAQFYRTKRDAMAGRNCIDAW